MTDDTAYTAWLKATATKPLAPEPRPVRVTIDLNGNRKESY